MIYNVIFNIYIIKNKIINIKTVIYEENILRVKI